MDKKPNNFLTGCIVIALFVCLSMFAGGLRALVYIGWAIACGVAVIFLLKLKRMDSTVIAVILMPAILYRHFLPKKLRMQLKELESKDDISSRP
jgi:membrane protein implicated in regulation of membrane protease activity